MKGAIAELSISDAIPEILPFYVSLIVSVVIKSLSLNKLFLLNPPLKKGDIGGFAPGCLEKIPPHPPLQRGENYLRISSNIFLPWIRMVLPNLLMK